MCSEPNEKSIALLRGKSRRRCSRSALCQQRHQQRSRARQAGMTMYDEWILTARFSAEFEQRSDMLAFRLNEPIAGAYDVVEAQC